MLQKFKDFPEKGLLIPVVRNAEVKFKKPGKGAVKASANIPDELVSETIASIEKKGRALIPVSVTISDSEGNITMTATYEWYIQKSKSLE